MKAGALTGVLSFCFCILLALKAMFALAGITISWFWVFSPVWVLLGLAAAFWVIAGTLAFLASRL